MLVGNEVSGSASAIAPVDVIEDRGSETLYVLPVIVLLDHQGGLVEAIAIELRIQHLLLLLGDLRAEYIHGHEGGVSTLVGVVGEHIAVITGDLRADEVSLRLLLDCGLYHLPCQVNTGQECTDDDGGNGAIEQPSPLLVDIGDPRVVKRTYCYVSSEPDEDGIDDVEVEGSDEVVEVHRRNAISCCTERRHEGGGNGDTGDHIPLIPTGTGGDACQTAEGGD